MNSIDIQQRIDTISNLVGCVGWRTEFLPTVANKVVDQMNKLLAVSRNQELDDRLRGGIENCNWMIEVMNRKLEELRSDLRQTLEEEKAVQQEDNPIDVDAPPKPY